MPNDCSHVLPARLLGLALFQESEPPMVLSRALVSSSVRQKHYMP